MQATATKGLRLTPVLTPDPCAHNQLGSHLRWCAQALPKSVKDLRGQSIDELTSLMEDMQAV